MGPLLENVGIHHTSRRNDVCGLRRFVNNLVAHVRVLLRSKRAMGESLANTGLPRAENVYISMIITSLNKGLERMLCFGNIGYAFTVI